MYLHVNKPKTRSDEPQSAVTMTGRHRKVLDQVLRVFGVASDHDLFSVRTVAIYELIYEAALLELK